MSQQPNASEMLTSELLHAMLLAGEDAKRAALRVLQGVSDTGQAPTRVEPYLSLREVSRQLNISAVSLWRWRVPGHILGGRRRFRMSEVEDYLESADFKRLVADLREQRKADAAGKNGRKGRSRHA